MSAVPDSIRLFIAITLPAALHSAIETVQQRMQQVDHNRAIRWAANDSLHLTLKFLGETPIDRVDAIIEAMQAASTQSPFALNIEGLGGFPDLRMPRVVWLGVTGDVAALHQLRDAVERTVAPLGFPTEARAFSPHLTLGRARPQASKQHIAQIGEQLRGMTIERLGSWDVSTLVLMRSDLQPRGAVYSVVSEVALR
jgi:2'-5' RNA ligase